MPPISRKSSSRAASKPIAAAPSTSIARPVAISVFLLVATLWAFYVNFHPSFSGDSGDVLHTAESILSELAHAAAGAEDGDPAASLGQISTEEKTARLVQQLAQTKPETVAGLGVTVGSNGSAIAVQQNPADLLFSELPVLGPVPTDGIKPLFGVKHAGGDAIFALACNYPKLFYQRFVGSVRKSGFDGDVVLAVSPLAKMKPGVESYVKKTKVIGYAFDVDCIGKDNCRLKDDFLGYPDPRPHRTFANIRYALYEYWLQYYSAQSYILILDFRDTFFQADPFLSFGSIATRTPKYELMLFAENARVKSIGNCVFNSLWVGRCFGKPALAALKQYPVLCSGSTLGSYQAIRYYVRTMLRSMDSVKCWLKGIESDQGYQNYLFYNGHFNPPQGLGNVTAFQQGDGVVNTIGAMNGKRVPKELKGSLDTHWKIRDKQGYILNNDGTRSACIHQWDRWYKDLKKFVDTKTFDY